MTHCPNDPQHCRCGEHHPGLSVYAKDPVAYANYLDRVRPLTLTVVTMPAPLDPEPCTGTMTCECPKCAQDRAELMQRRQHARQPWQIAA